MSNSIYDQQRIKSANNSYNQFTYFNRQVQAGIKLSSANTFKTHGFQTEQQQRFGIVAAAVPGRGITLLSTLAYGNGINGTGVFMPPPQPGTNVITTGDANSNYILGTKLDLPNKDEIGIDVKARGLPVTLPPFLPIFASNSIGFSVVSPLLKNNLNLSRGKLNTSLPGSYNLQAFYSSGSYSSVLGDNITSSNASVNTALTPLGNSSKAIAGEGALNNNVAEFKAYLNGDSEAGLVYVDPSNLETYTRTNAVTLTAADKIVRAQQDLNRLQRLESVLNLVNAQDDYRRLTYSLIQNELKDKWQQPFDEGSGLFDQAVKIFDEISASPLLKTINTYLGYINKYLPNAMAIYKFFKPDVDTNPTVDVGALSADLNTLSFSVNYQYSLDVLNNYLPETLHFILVDSTHLKIGSISIFTNFVVSFDSELINLVTEINTYLPTDLSLKITKERGQYKAIFVINGIIITVNGLQLGAVSVDLVSAINHELLCALPSELASKIKIRFDSETNQLLINDKPSDNEGNTVIPFDVNLIKGGINSFLQNISQLPIDIVNGNVNINTFKLTNFGVDKINSVLPDGMKIGLKMDGSKLKGATIGPLSFDLTTGGLKIITDNPAGLRSGIEVLDAIGYLPASLQVFKQATLTCVMPYDKLLGLDKYYSQRFITPEFGSFKTNAVNSTFVIENSTFTVDPQTGAQTESADTDTEFESVFSTSDSLDIFNQNQQEIEIVEFGTNDDLYSINIGGDLFNLPSPNFISNITKGSLLPLLSVGLDIIGSLAPKNSSPSALPGTSNTGYSPINGKYYGGGFTDVNTNYGYGIPVCSTKGSLDLTEFETLLPNSSSGTESTSNNTTFDLAELPAFQATVPSLSAEFELDPLNGKSALITELLKYGIGAEVPELIVSVDNFVFGSPSKQSTDLFDNVFNNSSIVESFPVGEARSPSIDTLLNIINSIADTPIQQVISAIKVETNISLPAFETTKLTDKRILLKLDCSDLFTFSTFLEDIVADSTSETYNNFITDHLQLPSLLITDLIQSPTVLIDWIKQVNPTLVPATEYLLLGDLSGFYKEVIYAKTGLNLDTAPEKLLLLNYLIQSYYGYAVPSADILGEFKNDIANV